MTEALEREREERAAIVAWLRKTGTDLFAVMNAKPSWTAEWCSLREQAETFEEAADRIERGEHLTPTLHDPIIGVPE